MQNRRQMSLSGKLRLASDTNQMSFFSCVRRGDIGKIDHFVDNCRIDVNTQDAWGNTPLYLACLCGHPKMVRVLLQKGARYDAGSIEIQRCFLSALTQEIRDIMREHESSCLVIDKQKDTVDFNHFLETMYERLPGYDLQLVTEDHVFLAHKCILCVRCEYFRQRLMEGGNPNIDILDFTGSVFSSTSMRAILQYIYTGRIDISADEEEEITKVTSFLGFSKLEEILIKETKRAVLLAGKKTKLQDVEVTVQYSEFKKQVKADMLRLSTGSVPLALHDTMVTEARRQSEKRNYFCDVCLSVEGNLFDCHKMILCGRSEFFHTLLIDKEDEQPPAFEDYRPTVKIDNVSAKDFVQIVSFIYTDNCLVTEDNIGALLKLSEIYALPGLKKKIMGEISSVLNTSNAVSLFSSAMETENKKLIQESCKYMAKNLESMQSMSIFQDLLFRELGQADGKAAEAGFAQEEPDYTESSEFMENLLYYIRGTVTTSAETEEANKKLQILNTMIQRQLGYSEKFCLLEVPKSSQSYGASRSQQRQRQEAYKSTKENSCVVQ